jgi:hypothetical protein
MIEDNLGVPFETMVLGATVVVERIDLTDRTILWLSASEGARCGRFGWLIFPCPLLCRQAGSGLRHICAGSAKKDRLIAMEEVG